MLLNFGIRALDSQVRNGSSGLHTMTGIIGTGVSGTFLYLLAVLNVIVLAGIVKVFREMRAGAYNDSELEEQLAKRGLMNRLLGPLARRVDSPWKMYPIGVLFGLGFDTATEVALLVLAGSAVVSGLPFYAVLSLPILFAAGMCLFDTADGCFMNFAYDWAFARPIRKVYYNLTITGLSVFVAFFIGTVEILGLIEQQYRLGGRFWTFMGNFDINKAGFVIVGVFVLTWVVALAVWHFGKIEQKWEASAETAGCRADTTYRLRPRWTRPGRPPTAGRRRGWRPISRQCGAVGHARRVAQRPAEFLDQPVALAVVAPHARGDTVFPGMQPSAAARNHMVDGLGPAAAVRAHVVVTAHQRAPGERNAAAVRHPDIAAEPDDRRHREHQ